MEERFYTDSQRVGDPGYGVLENDSSTSAPDPPKRKGPDPLREFGPEWVRQWWQRPRRPPELPPFKPQKARDQSVE